MMDSALRAFADLSAAIALAAFTQVQACVSTAPTIISKELSAGHHP